jgi:polynucleotide 5'-hydroxyl-kinase GRC3/NOL9
MSTAMTTDGIVSHPAWRRLDLAALCGTVMILGDTDVGKSTFARYLFAELGKRGCRVAYLDGDMGQSTLGLPATMVAALGQKDGPPTFPPEGPRAVFFVGAVSPTGHMLPTLVGAHRLQKWAEGRGAQVVLMDTTGLVAREAGGGALKQWKIELLQPTTILALARDAELEHILWPLRRRATPRVHELPVAQAVAEKSRQVRIARRERRFRRYFAGAGLLTVPLDRVPVVGLEGRVRNRLLAFQNGQGFALELGVVETLDARRKVLSVRTPLPGLEGVESLRLGDLKVDPTSGQQMRDTH